MSILSLQLNIIIWGKLDANITGIVMGMVWTRELKIPAKDKDIMEAGLDGALQNQFDQCSWYRHRE